MESGVPNPVGSGLLLFGAFLVGETLHRAFVRQTVAPTSLPFLLGLGIGGALLYGGYRLEHAESSPDVPDAEGRDDEEADDSASRLDADRLGDRDRRDEQ